MSSDNARNWSEGVLRRAGRDALERSFKSFAYDCFVLLVGVATTAAGAIRGFDPLREALTFAGIVGAGALAALSWQLIRAPFRQRDEARTDRLKWITTLEESTRDPVLRRILELDAEAIELRAKIATFQHPAEVLSDASHRWHVRVGDYLRENAAGDYVEWRDRPDERLEQLHAKYAQEFLLRDDLSSMQPSEVRNLDSTVRELADLDSDRLQLQEIIARRRET